MPVIKNAVTTFRISSQEKIALKLLAKKKDVHLSDIIRELVLKKLRKEKLIN